MNEEAQFKLVKDTLLNSLWHMRTLQVVRGLGLLDWAIGAGFVRNAVWDQLHGFDTMTPLADVDVLFFDRADPSPKREAEIETTCVCFSTQTLVSSKSSEDASSKFRSTIFFHHRCNLILVGNADLCRSATRL